MKTQQGFTLIELMIVIAIIGILAAIAIPAYQNYVVRAKVTEGLTLMDNAKVGVTEYYQTKGTLPESNASAGIAPAASIAGKYVSGVKVGDSGVITATFASSVPDIGGKALTLTPNDANGNLTWVCSGSVASKYRPSSCR